MILFVPLALAQDASTPVRVGTPPPLEERPFLRDPEGFGLGIILGLPTGLSAAYRPADTPLYFDAALAWSFGASGGYAVHFDVLYTLAELRNDDELPDVIFPVYMGVGPRTRIGGPSTDPVALGIRVPLGMSFYHEDVPIEGFVELVPGLGLVPRSAFWFEAAIGARYYFGKPKPTPKAP